jgi:hypothetical protein
MEWGGFTQCLDPGAIWLQIDLYRWNVRKDKWIYVRSDSETRFGWITPVYPRETCGNSNVVTYRVQSWSQYDGIHMTPYPATSPDTNVNCGGL